MLHFLILIVTASHTSFKYYLGHKIKKNEMEGTCSTYGMRNAYNTLVSKAKGKRPLGRPRRGWKNNI
jgi:hypothetical protein